MNKSPYYRLAINNLKKNRQFYLPYLLTCIGCVMAFYIMLTLQGDPALERMSGGADVGMTLMLGTIVIGLFSIAILFYTSTVMIKHRKKEFGLYNILGMEKKHIGRILRWESFYTIAMSLIFGMVGGFGLSLGLRRILLEIMGWDVKFELDIEPTVILLTAICYTAILVAIHIRMRVMIHLSKPIELLKGSDTGEREPKSRWALAVLGIICIVAGYGVSLATRNALYAILLFFVAVILVIAGTYLMFIAFSTLFLKKLRNNKKYYYNSKHFVMVSGMLYRMKRNAAGLASICILSTMVLVTVSTTVCLYAGGAGMLEDRYPNDIMVRYMDDISPEDADSIREDARNIAKRHDTEIKNYSAYTQIQFIAENHDGKFALSDDFLSNGYSDYSCTVCLYEVDGYEYVSGKTVSLGDDELLCYYEGKHPVDEISMGGEQYKVRQIGPVEGGFFNSGYASIGIDAYYLIGTETTVEKLTALQEEAYGEDCSMPYQYVSFDLSGEDKQTLACARELMTYFETNSYSDSLIFADSKQIYGEDSFGSFFGAFLFLGVFLGLLFLLATVLIIYYKQISEGYDDQRRFRIMQQVGMTRSEVKVTIRMQVLTVFFLPITVAAIHVLFAFPMVRYILSAFGMTNVALFATCTVITLLIFAVIYAIVYISTSRTYYRIINA